MEHRSILIVTGNPDVHAAFRAILERHGAEVITAATASDGLFEARRLRPSLVVTDYPTFLPDGITLARALRSDPLTDTIPVLALVSRAMPLEWMKAREDGCTTVLASPASLLRAVSVAERLMHGYSVDLQPME